MLYEVITNFKPRRSRPRLITGHDLFAEFGLESSPLYKKILERVEEERLSEGNLTRRDALALAGKLIRDQRPEVRDRKSEIRKQKSVITSYSIHYTKLYEYVQHL